MNKTLAICDRCRMTFKRYDLMKDPNALGLRVSKNCINKLNYNLGKLENEIRCYNY